MRNTSKDRLLLCKLQAEAFEKSIEKLDTSSEIFIRRFMKSEIAKKLDNESVLYQIHFIQGKKIASWDEWCIL